MVKKVTLPNHDALLTALVAINLATYRDRKYFTELFSEASRQSKLPKRSTSPSLGSQFPFRHDSSKEKAKRISFLRRKCLGRLKKYGKVRH